MKKIFTLLAAFVTVGFMNVYAKVTPVATNDNQATYIIH